MLSSLYQAFQAASDKCPPRSWVTCSMSEGADDPYRKAPKPPLHKDTKPSEVRLGTLDLRMRTQEEISGDLLAGNLSPAGAISLCGISKSVSPPCPIQIQHKFSDKTSLFFCESFRSLTEHDRLSIHIAHSRTV